jgi:hypothetical protein
MCVSLIFVILGNKKRNSWPYQNTIKVSLWATVIIVLSRLYAEWGTAPVIAFFILMLILTGTMVYYYKEYRKYKNAKRKAEKTKGGHAWESDE